MARPANRIARAVSGLVVFVGVAVGAFTLLGLLGIFTGVMGICAFAPEWWASTYFLLLPAAPPLCGAYAAVKVDRKNFPRLK